jgi:hypothetical protein
VDAGPEQESDFEEVPEDERIRRIVLGHVRQLAEHFESVQVFVTVHRREGTRMVSNALDLGSGCWYTRYGQVREWLLMNDERARQKAAEEFAAGDADGG